MKQLLLDLIGLCYSQKLDWKLIKHKKNLYHGDSEIPSGYYLLHDTPDHKSDVYARLGLFGHRITTLYVVRGQLAYRSSRVYEIPLGKERTLAEELYQAVQWAMKTQEKNSVLVEYVEAKEIVADIIRKDAEASLTQALKGIK